MEITPDNIHKLGESALQTIHHISFMDNNIGHSGSLDIIIQLLIYSDILESAAIIRNSLNDSHATEICKLLKRSKTLSQLSLCWNGFTDYSVQKLADAVRNAKCSLLDMG